jgi:outer membrane protein assembly factor BamB
MVTTADCGTWGITSTGAIDPTRGLLFVIGATGSLHALDLSTGEESGSYPEQVVDQTAYEYVWGGLRIAGGRVYVPIASYCDVGAPDGLFPEGSLKSLPLDRGSGATVWDPVPGPQNLGGIWGWGGVSVDPRDGSIFTAVGNSHAHSDACDCFVDDAGYGDHVVHLTADLSSVIDAENPGIPGTGDYDFGAAPMLFQPEGCPPLAAANNKNGTLYVWNRTSLAGSRREVPSATGALRSSARRRGRRQRETVYEAQAALFAPAAARQRCPCVPGDGGLSVHRSVGGSLGDGNQATPLVGDVVFATGGKPGGFFALDVRKGARLWSAPTDGRTVAATITVGGSIFGADTKGTVYAFRPAPFHGSPLLSQ